MIKSLTMAALGALSAAALAGPDPLGTKTDPVSAPARFDAGGPGLMTLLQTVLVLGAVLFLLKTFLPKILLKFNKGLKTTLDGEIRVKESATFAGGSLFVVEARAKALLVSVGANGVTCLAELETSAKGSEQPLFMELVEEHTRMQASSPNVPTHAVVSIEEPRTAEEADVAHEERHTLLRNPQIDLLRNRGNRA